MERRPIRVLDHALVDQIAAGEVIERPASIVKELLENSLDAGATNLEVKIEGGGIDRLLVADDGSGIDPSEVALAVTRHATSKITSFDDLARIRTLGFRGEALPSIASVSRFTLTSRVPSSPSAMRIVIEGGAAPSIRETGGAPGTVVEVRDLFFNVPARRKFLKSPATETAHVGEICFRIALALPGCRLSYFANDRRVREYLPLRSRAERAQQLFAGESLRPVAGSRDGIAVEALLGPPERARSGAKALHIYVNGRAVRDRALARSIAFAYGSVLPPGRYPTGVAFLEIDPESVDVNVHPQKAEVRFAGREVLDTITRILRHALGTPAPASTSAFGPAARPPAFWDERLGPNTPWPSSDETPWPEPSEEPSWVSGAIAVNDRPAEYAARTEPSLLETGFFSRLRVLGQARSMLLVCEGEDALYLVDQHAADERLRYERLRRSYDAKHVATQRMLFPARMEVSDDEAALVEERRDEIAAVGFECSLVGPRELAIHAVPALVQRAAPERLVRDLLDELSRRGERAFGDAIDTAIATMACHGAIRAGDSLSIQEAQVLLRSLDEIGEFRGHCPHGRPVAHTISFREIERQLGRA
jgi:DNA mismatch repair protein MutL